MRLYITVPKFCVDEIVVRGLTPENCGSLSGLPFLILRSDKPQVITGQAAYLGLEIDDNDPSLMQVNRVQYEYYEDVPVSQLVEIAWPPSENGEVIELYERCGKDTHDPVFKSQWEFHPMSSSR